MCMPRHIWKPDDNFVCRVLLPPCLRQDVLLFPTSCARLAGPRTSGNPPASHLSVTAHWEYRDP